jgi:hypothetical protein
MERATYLRFDRSIERPPDNEAKAIATILASIEKTSAASQIKQKHGIRQQHAKGHGFLRGELHVYDGLPTILRQGLFSTPRSYPVIVRYSTAFGDLRSDRIRAPRGLAIKVLGVVGPKALGDDGSSNQDFLLVNHKNYIADARSYLRVQWLAEKQPGLGDLFMRGLGVVARGYQRLTAGFSTQLPFPFLASADAGCDIVGETFYSEGALRFGDYVARIQVAPSSPQALARRGQPAHDADDAVKRRVAGFFRDNGAEYELRAQLAVNLERTPIEDAAVDWSEEVSPFQPVGKIVLPPQEVDSQARRDYAQDTLSFNPWRALADHQPLGSIMRIRQAAYRRSSELRHKANSDRPMIEPRDISEFPD